MARTKKPANRLVVGPATFTAPPRGSRIREQVQKQSLQHGEMTLDSKTAEGCSVRRIAARVKHGVAPLFLEFRGGPSVLICTPDRSEVRIPATDLRTVREVYSSIQACTRMGRGEDGPAATPRTLGKCVLKVAHQYGIEPTGARRKLSDMTRTRHVAPPRRKPGKKKRVR